MSAAIHRFTAISTMVCATLSVVCELRRRGCRVLGASALPQAAVRVDRAPRGIDAHGYFEPPPGTIALPAEHVAIVRGVRVTWFATVNPYLNRGRRYA